MNKELRKQLQEDILSRYDNEEYWDTNVIEAFEQDNMDSDKLSKCCNYPTYKQSGDCGKCGQPNKCDQNEYLREKEKWNKLSNIEKAINQEPKWDKLKCDHEWKWNYDCFEDAKIMELDTLGVPVKCSKCSCEAVEWWGYSCVKDNNGNIID